MIFCTAVVILVNGFVYEMYTFREAKSIGLADLSTKTGVPSTNLQDMLLPAPARKKLHIRIGWSIGVTKGLLPGVGEIVPFPFRPGFPGPGSSEKPAVRKFQPLHEAFYRSIPADLQQECSFGHGSCIAIQTGPDFDPRSLPAYSTDPISAFYGAAKENFDYSKILTKKEGLLAQSWRDIPLTNLNGVTWLNRLFTGFLSSKSLFLHLVSVALLKQNIALSDAINTAFSTKFKYNLLRPISYIRNVMGHPNYKTVIHRGIIPGYLS